MRQDKPFGRVRQGETTSGAAGGDEDPLPGEDVHRLGEIISGHAQGGSDVTHANRRGAAEFRQMQHGLQGILGGAIEPHGKTGMGYNC
jgi:hypothetical protein